MLLLDSIYIYFISNYFYIQHPTKGAMKYQPFEYQDRLIDSYHSYRYSISLMPRQTGKSTTAAGYLLWYAMFVPDSTILVAAHKYTGSQEIMHGDDAGEGAIAAQHNRWTAHTTVSRRRTL